MTTNLNLGVFNKKELSSPSKCYGMGHDTAKISDSLLFAEYYLDKITTRPLSNEELARVSTGIYSSSGAAGRMKFNSPNPEFDGKLEAYERHAIALNNRVKKLIAQPVKAGEAQDLSGIKKGTGKLRTEVGELLKTANNFCVLERKVMGTSRPVMGAPRMAMAGRGRPAGIKRLAAPVEPAAEQAVTPLSKFAYPTFSRPAFHKSRR